MLVYRRSTRYLASPNGDCPSSPLLASCSSCSFDHPQVNRNTHHIPSLSHLLYNRRSSRSNNSMSASLQSECSSMNGNQLNTIYPPKKCFSSGTIKHSLGCSMYPYVPNEYSDDCSRDGCLSKADSINSMKRMHTTSCNSNKVVSGLSTFSVPFLISISLLSICCVSATAKHTAIPGCADIDNLEETFSFETSSLNDLLLCFCKVKNDSNVAISCLYGSSLEDLSKAISLVADANATVDEIALSHVEFNETGLPDDFFNRNSSHLKTLSIGLCAQPGALQINEGSLRGLEGTLENLALTDCNIDEIPPALHSLTALRTLSLARNRLTSLTKEDLSAHKNLQSLNLAGNFINSMEEGTLGQISDTLETFIFGEHNFINESIFKEIAQLQNIKVLDLSKADGINDFPEGMFENLNKLERLLLMGCSLTTINNQTFRGLNTLTELDLRVNLIREVQCAAFKSLSSIRRLSLAGNYLNSTEDCVWRDLVKIEELDLSWNELTQLPADTFAQIGATLQILNLRHNANLSQIDENAFRNLTNLRRLNLSDTSITHIDRSILAHLTSLEALDLSSSQITFIDEESLYAQNTTLDKLTLGGNQLRTLSTKLLHGLEALRQLDLSSNPWLCDAAIKNLVDEINEKYKAAAQASSEFSLENANATNCDRPYSLRGEVITNVDPKLLVEYDEAIDTTTAKPTTTTTPTNNTDNEQTTQAFTFFPNEGIVGDESKQDLDHSQTATRAPPEYDINARQTLNDNSNHQLVATLIAIIVIGAVSITIIVAVVLYIKKKKTENANAIADTEMNARPKYDTQTKCNNVDEGKK